MGKQTWRLAPKIRSIVKMAWLAGLYEGEGTACTARAALQLSISTNNKRLMERLRQIYPAFRLYGPYWSSPIANKPMYSVRAHGENAAFLACLIEPYLSRVRRSQLNKAWQEWRPRAHFPSAVCHPQRRSYALGQCRRCYSLSWQLRHRVT